jgi:hypothetical protein
VFLEDESNGSGTGPCAAEDCSVERWREDVPANDEISLVHDCRLNRDAIWAADVSKTRRTRWFSAGWICQSPATDTNDQSTICAAAAGG